MERAVGNLISALETIVDVCAERKFRIVRFMLMLFMWTGRTYDK